MNLSEIATKEQFVSRVADRLTKTYTVPVHSIGALIAIGASFYLTFLAQHDLVPTLRRGISSDNTYLIASLDIIALALINAGSFVAVFLTYKFFFKGLSVGSTPYFVYYRYGPIDFLKWSYVLVSIAAITISSLGLEFVSEGRVGPLSPLEAFYYVVGVVSTTGSNISPSSTATEVLSIVLSGATLLMVVFLFQHVSNIQLNKKLAFSFSQRRLEYVYDELVGIISESELTDKQKARTFSYFLEEFDFDQPDGTSRIVMRMKEGDYSFAFRADR
jgi:hypothetical protein